MAIQLDTLQQRIIGVLIEKQMTVPDTYPLTINALLAGCNQKNNRDPQMAVEDFDVEGAVRALMDDAWVSRVERDGGRAHRYGHEAQQQLGVEPADLALLAELLNRGPQAPGALKTRAARMHPFASPGEVEARLEAMAARPVPYVVRLPKLPREHAPRWRHLLDGVTAEAALASEGDDAPRTTSTAPAPTPATTAPPPQAVGPQGPDLRERLAALESAVEALQARLDRLEG